MKSHSRFLSRLGVALMVGTLGACGAPPGNGDGSSDAAADTASSDAALRMDSTMGSDSASNSDSAAMNDSAQGSDASSMSDGGGSTDAMSNVDAGTAMDATGADAMSADAMSADVAVSMDAARPDGSLAADSGLVCSVQGDWTTTVMMSFMLAFRFRADGTWEGATSPTSLGTAMAIPTGNYSTASGTIVLTNDPGGGSGCTMGDRGEYRIAYDPACGTMVWTLVSDTCAGRSAALNGATFRRYAPDGGVADAGADASMSGDAGACSMRASWSTAFGGGGMMMAAMRFNADTTWVGATTAAALMGGMVIPLGNYSEASGRIVLTNDPGTGSGCAMGDRGEYSIAYSVGCNSARWTLVSDTCTGRSAALNGAVFTRL